VCDILLNIGEISRVVNTIKVVIPVGLLEAKQPLKGRHLDVYFKCATIVLFLLNRKEEISPEKPYQYTVTTKLFLIGQNF
jgi:hypothetical protein